MPRRDSRRRRGRSSRCRRRAPPSWFRRNHGAPAMTLAVIGSGYVGLVAGACFAETGHTVWCADIAARKIASLQDYVLPIYAPGLDAIVARNQADGRLSFTTDVAAAVANADVVFIAVGTPPDD